MNYNSIKTKKILLTKNGLDLIRQKLDDITAKKHRAAKKLRALVKDKNDNTLAQQMYNLEIIEAESLQLDSVLQNAETIINEENPETVSLGCTVELKKQDKQELYTIVCALEIDVEHHKISEDSILGGALLNKKVGDIFSITTPRGTMVTYEVVSIT